MLSFHNAISSSNGSNFGSTFNIILKNNYQFFTSLPFVNILHKGSYPDTPLPSSYISKKNYILEEMFWDFNY